MSRVKLFILRHGEREDEAIVKAFYREQERIWNNKPDNQVPFNVAYNTGLIPLPPQTDNLDPPLTVKGHLQAQLSFNALVKTLGGRKVAIFCSPLRRTVGTALMVGTVSSHDDSVSWIQPTYKESNPADKSIPITVLNGLGDFASNVYRLGGCSALVPTGSLRCADMAINDGSCESPFIKSIETMPSNEVECPNITTPVRFWRRSNLGRYKFLPMSPPICPSTKSFVEKEKCTKYNLPQGYEHAPENPINTVDEAIRLTFARGCDTCIIVAHREVIRDLTKICGYHGSIPHPYCCIGSFDATYQQHQPVQYQLSNIWAADNFERHTPEAFPTLSHGGTSDVMLLIPGVADQLICTIDSHLDVGSLDRQIWLSTKKDAHVDSTHHVRSKCLNLKIVQGRSLWNHYLALLQGENQDCSRYINGHIVATVRKKGRRKLYGWATWILPDGKKHVMRVKVAPRNEVHCELSSFATLTVFY